MSGQNRKQVNAILRKSIARAEHVKRQRELREVETCICGVPGCARYPPNEITASQSEAKQA